MKDEKYPNTSIICLAGNVGEDEFELKRKDLGSLPQRCHPCGNSKKTSEA